MGAARQVVKLEANFIFFYFEAKFKHPFSLKFCKIDGEQECRLLCILMAPQIDCLRHWGNVLVHGGKGTQGAYKRHFHLGNGSCE